MRANGLCRGENGNQGTTRHALHTRHRQYMPAGKDRKAPEFFQECQEIFTSGEKFFPVDGHDKASATPFRQSTMSELKAKRDDCAQVQPLL
jgi:hypothetical protein